MTLIEGIGDEVTHFFIGLVLLAIVCAAWWTTSIAEHRHVQTVWLLDRRRHRAHRRLTNHTHAVTIAEGTSSSESPPLVATAAMEAKPPEAEASTSAESRSEEDERSQIVQTMDSDTCVLRQRRLAFYNRVTASNAREGEDSNAPPTTSCTANQIMEHNYAEAPPSSDNQTARNIRIKLKYINDDLKLVDGKLQEQLGDFKKRHFHVELSSNKLVRLIFNGQVLQQDTKTLEGCGLFDNCVVHCLIHQRRSSPEDSSQESRGEAASSGRNANPNNNNQGRDWDLGNFLFAVISFTLLSAWYFRYVYAHLYTVTATVGLILMTGVFSIVLFGFYFPDHEHLPQRMEAPQT